MTEPQSTSHRTFVGGWVRFGRAHSLPVLFLTFIIATVLVLVPGCSDEAGIVSPDELLLSERFGLEAASEWNVEYEVIRLGTVDGMDSSFPRAINDKGQIAGTAMSEEQERQAFLWSEEQGMVGLDQTEESTSCFGTDLNIEGVVVGHCEESGLSDRVPIRWDELESSVKLPLDDKHVSGWADAVNDVGAIAGTVRQVDENDEPFDTAVVWQENEAYPRHLDPLDGHTSSYAHAINNRGDVAGQSGGHAVVWLGSHNEPTPLPDGDNRATPVVDINENRDVIGGGPGDPVLWLYDSDGGWHMPIEIDGQEVLDLTNQTDGKIQLVGHVPEGSRSEAVSWTVDVESGNVVHTQTLPLPDGLRGRTLARASAINAAGWIAGDTRSRHDAPEATLWTPVDAPDNGDDDNGDDDKSEDDHCPPGHQRQGRC